MIQTEQKEPRLAKPGDGLPFYEWALANYILVPIRLRTTTPRQALDQFADESGKIIAAASRLSPVELAIRRLIPRLRGLEDSSRFWSVAMTLQHLIIVNDRMKSLIVSLSNGIQVETDKPSSTADVKPSADVNPETICRDYRKNSDDFIATITDLAVDKFPELKYAHPWFGPLNAQEWQVFAPMHQEIHRNQITEIIKRL